MGFLRKLFGNNNAKKSGGDERGIYFSVQCGKCENVMRVRADKQYDLNRNDNGFSWRKTIVCDQCFQKMAADVQFDSRHNITSQEIDKGKFMEAAGE